MTVMETLKVLLRRWYILVPGLLLAVVAAVGLYSVQQPQYERTATQLLLPGKGTIPSTASNPYLFLGNISQAADVIVRSMNSDEVQGVVERKYPGTTVQVSRDPLASGPVVLFTVQAPSDEAAAGGLDELLQRSEATLQKMQTEQNIAMRNRISSSVLTHDDVSTLKQKTRLLNSVLVGAGLVAVTLVTASVVEGLSRTRSVSTPSRSPRRGRRSGLSRTGVDKDVPASQGTTGARGDTAADREAGEPAVQPRPREERQDDRELHRGAVHAGSLDP